MKPSFPLLEKVAKEEKKDYSNFGTTAGVVAGGISAPIMMSIFGRVKPQEIASILDNPANHEEVFQETYQGSSHLKEGFEQGNPGRLHEYATSVADKIKQQAEHRLIHEPNISYYREANALAKKKGRLGLAAAVGMGILTPLLGGYIGSKFNQKK